LNDFIPSLAFSRGELTLSNGVGRLFSSPQASEKVSTTFLSWYDFPVSGFVALADQIFLAVAIYTSLRMKSASEDLENIHPVDDFETLIDRRSFGDAAFDALFRKHIASLSDKYLFTKITGASSPNGDGSRRAPIIERCEPMEHLRLEPEPDHSIQPNAIAVKRLDGSLLGYLESRVACNLHRDAGKPASWSAIFKHANRNPATGEAVEAVIVLMRSRIAPDSMTY
jgi:hypothetical protein